MIVERDIVSKIISDYTRESGVRSLDKHLAKLARARAKQVAFEEEFTPSFSVEELEKVLGKPKFRNDEYEIKDMIGVVTGDRKSVV